MLVTIVAVPNADNSGLDVNRLEKVEDLHPEIAQKMLDVGTAREPSAEELAEYRKAVKVKQDADAKATAKAETKPVSEVEPKLDEGGSLPSGAAPAVNNTDEPEPVATPPASE